MHPCKGGGSKPERTMYFLQTRKHYIPVKQHSPIRCGSSYNIVKTFCKHKSKKRYIFVRFSFRPLKRCGYRGFVVGAPRKLYIMKYIQTEGRIHLRSLWIYHLYLRNKDGNSLHYMPWNLRNYRSRNHLYFVCIRESESWDIILWELNVDGMWFVRLRL